MLRLVAVGILSSMSAMLFWLRPHRVEALHALALLARRGEPLDSGLARLAAEDVALRPWAARLARVPAARRAGTGTWLHAAGLLRAHAADDLDEAEAAGQGDAVLAALAGSYRRRPRGLILVAWWPIWLLVATACGLAAGTGLIMFSGFAEQYAGLGFNPSDAQRVLFELSPITVLVAGLVLAGIAASLLRFLALVPWCRLLRGAWWFHGFRLWALVRLLRGLAAVTDVDSAAKRAWADLREAEALIRWPHRRGAAVGLGAWLEEQGLADPEARCRLMALAEMELVQHLTCWWHPIFFSLVVTAVVVCLGSVLGGILGSLLPMFWLFC